MHNPFTRLGRPVEILWARLALSRALSPVVRPERVLELLDRAGPALVSGAVGTRALMAVLAYPDPALATRAGMALLDAGAPLPASGVWHILPDEEVALAVMNRGAAPTTRVLMGWCHHPGWPRALARGLELAPTAWPTEGLAEAVCFRATAAAIAPLLAHGVDVNAPDGMGIPALHWATSFGNKDVVEVLLAAGANPAVLTRDGKRTALAFARDRSAYWHTSSEVSAEDRLKSGVPTDDNEAVAVVQAVELAEAIPTSSAVRPRRRF